MAKRKTVAVKIVEEKGHTLDPRQVAFLTLYLDPNSDTFANALQSGLAAGYSQEYSESITAKMPAWLAENGGNTKMLLKAERNLDQMLDLEPERIARTRNGRLYKKYSSEILKVKADVSKFVASTIGRKTYRTRDDDGGNTYVQNNFFGKMDLSVVIAALPQERQDYFYGVISSLIEEAELRRRNPAA